MMSCKASCHEGEAAERAAAVMERLGIDIVPVTNDNDRVTGVVFADDLARALRQPSSASRLRDVMRRTGFVVCGDEEPARISRRLRQASAECAVVVDAVGSCIGIVDGRDQHG